MTSFFRPSLSRAVSAEPETERLQKAIKWRHLLNALDRLNSMGTDTTQEEIVELHKDLGIAGLKLPTWYAVDQLIERGITGAAEMVGIRWVKGEDMVDLLRRVRQIVSDHLDSSPQRTTPQERAFQNIVGLRDDYERLRKLVREGVAPIGLVTKLQAMRAWIILLQTRYLRGEFPPSQIVCDDKECYEERSEVRFNRRRNHRFTDKTNYKTGRVSTSHK